MNRPLLLKTLAIVVLTLLILIPLGLIRDTVQDRQQHRQEAVASIAASYAGSQTVTGPILVVPYKIRIDELTGQDAGGKKTYSSRTEDRQYLFFPKDLQMQGKLLPAERYRGLHKVHVYELQSLASGSIEFDLPSPAKLEADRISLQQPYLSIGISDVRGLVGSPTFKIDAKPLPVEQGAGSFGSGMHVNLPAATLNNGGKFDFSLDLTLAGTENLAITPLADNNRIELASSWPHPQFGGSFLPRTREISDKGFHAVWEVSSLASGAQRALLTGSGSRSSVENLEIQLAEPVNIYSQADRATKYGLLFVLLTFVGFFIFETIKQLPIHPIQYLLVGLGLAIFFLLLVSLSEHIEFWIAYLIASVACIGLLGFYLSQVLRSVARALGFSAMLTLLYGTLYGLLVSEDNALLLGSLMLFVILAIIMTVTRKIDWYQTATLKIATDE
ncbi:inner membrane CreD family protein [Collimonas arenae]|uniref:Inner membrane CreD family protein n=1 Tax=Collimonas arenae TaxID=279058 RepID=A0A127QQ18_9BURK|nr:cell envelope integrity protein CreD [Collimonas arenae]AMP02240.1 inner membrane CreD family protein [Collimonas arenae]AMP12136.1 inner membrane CreD family protein [Collimonas arenae]